MSQDQLRILKLFGESHEAFRAGMDDSVFSPIHIDYRLDNLLIDDSSDQLLVTAVDWQSIAIGNPLTDVGYFLGAGLLPEARRECEKEIVEIYHQRLLAAGIKDYSFDQCWKDYRRSSFAGFSVTVVASMLVQQTSEEIRCFWRWLADIANMRLIWMLRSFLHKSGSDHIKVSTFTTISLF